MFAHPGKKLMFMGCEFGQWREWNYDASLDWHLLQYPEHEGLRRWVQDLNHIYQREPSLHEVDFEHARLQLDRLLRQREQRDVVRPPRPESRRTSRSSWRTSRPCRGPDYRIGVPEGGWYRELLNSDSARYGGSNMGNGGGVHADAAADARLRLLDVADGPAARVRAVQTQLGAHDQALEQGLLSQCLVARDQARSSGVGTLLMAPRLVQLSAAAAFAKRRMSRGGSPRKQRVDERAAEDVARAGRVDRVHGDARLANAAVSSLEQRRAARPERHAEHRVMRLAQALERARQTLSRRSAPPAHARRRSAS